MNNLSIRKNKIPSAVIPRILYYLKVVRQLEKEDKLTVSSEDLAKRLNISACLIRKDLTRFGKFGHQRIGYEISSLKSHLMDIINGRQICNLAIVGVGNLGSALLNYKGFKEEGLKFVAAFDKDETKVGKLYGDIIVEHMDRLKETTLKKKNVHIGIIAVSAESAQTIANKFIDTKIFCILNFASSAISVPPGIILHNVDLSSELKALQYFSINK